MDLKSSMILLAVSIDEKKTLDIADNVIYERWPADPRCLHKMGKSVYCARAYFGEQTSGPAARLESELVGFMKRIARSVGRTVATLLNGSMFLGMGAMWMGGCARAFAF